MLLFVSFFVVQGNYDAYVKTRAELEENQMKQYQWEKDQMQHMKVSYTVNPLRSVNN